MDRTLSDVASLLAKAQDAAGLLYPVEDQLGWLIHWNHPDRAVNSAAILARDMIKLLHKGESGQAYILDTLRLALESLRPFVDEAPEDKVKTVLALYAVPLPTDSLPEPSLPPAVSDRLWEQWTSAKKLRTLDGLRTMAEAKGLRLLRNDIPKPRRYSVVYPGGTTEEGVYKKVAKAIEGYQPP